VWQVHDGMSVSADGLVKPPMSASNLASGATCPTATRVEVDVAPARFYECASSFADFNLYQTPAFNTVMAAMQGAHYSSIVVFRGDVPIGACALRIKAIPVLGWGLAYALGGPLWQRPHAGVADLCDVLAAIRVEYGHRRRLSVWLKPRLWRESADSALHQAVFDDNHFSFCPDRATAPTLLLDLRPSVDEMRQRLHRSWRRYLLKAERCGLEISTDRSDASFAAFLPLYDELKAVKGFRGIDGDAMRRAHVALPEQLRMGITLCRSAGRIIAGQVASLLGDTCLGIIGAANAEGRECNAAYLVWWERLLRAKEHGCLWYDMGGFDHEANPTVAQAKLRMGGQLATFLGEFHYDPSRQRAWLLRTAEVVYWLLRRHRGVHRASRAPCARD